MKNIDLKCSFDEGKLIINCSLLNDKYLGKKGEVHLIYSTFEKSSNKSNTGIIAGKINIVYEKYFELKFEIDEENLVYQGDKIYIGYKVDFYFLENDNLFILDEKILVINIFPNILVLKNQKNISLNEKQKDNYNILKSIYSFTLKGKIFFLIFLLLIFAISYYFSYILGTILFVGFVYFSLHVFSLSYVNVDFIDGELYDGKSLSSIFRGKFNVKLENFLIEVHLVNIEKIKTYYRGMGDGHRTYYTNNIVNSIKIFSKKIDIVQKNDSVENYLTGQINFKEIYEKLLPPIITTADDGLFLMIEFKLIHKDFIDYNFQKEIYLDKKNFKMFKNYP